MDDKAGGQSESRGDDGFAGVDRCESVAGCLEFAGTGSHEDGTADTTAHLQLGIRGIDDGIGLDAGDVALNDFKWHKEAPFCGVGEGKTGAYRKGCGLYLF